MKKDQISGSESARIVMDKVVAVMEADNFEALIDLESQIAAVFSGKVVTPATNVCTGNTSGYMIPIPFPAISNGIEYDILKDISNDIIPFATPTGNVTSHPTGMKFDNGKLDWALLPFESVEEIIKVLMVGAKKYKRDNWQLVEDGDTRYFNAAMRHLTAWKQGEELDPETDLPHLAHAGCCLLFLISKNRIGYNVKE